MTNNYKSFASDNYAGVHPRVMHALSSSAQGLAPAYGADHYTAQAIELFKEQFGPNIDVFFVFNGTGANMLSLNAVAESYQSIICAETAHINTDECGAIEKSVGARLIPIKTLDGKLTKDLITPYLQGFNDQHRAQPRVISISQATEYGTIYQPHEIAALAELAHAHGMVLHVDGSRLANAAVALKTDLRCITTDCGVDALSFGGTKNGMMFGEAVVFFGKEFSERAKYLRKQLGQLASKHRFIAAQFIELLGTDLWRQNAAQANDMAQRLAHGLHEIPQIDVTQDVTCNVIFARLPTRAIEMLQKDYGFYVWNAQKSEVRWMTGFDTTAEQVDEFLASIRLLFQTTRY